MKKILFITQKLSGGGAERVVAVLSGALKVLGYDVSIIIYFPTKSEYPIRCGVKKIYLAENEKEYRKIKFLKKISLLRKEIQEHKAEYLCPFLWFVGIHTFLASIGLNVRVIQTVRNNPNIVPRKWYLRFARNMCMFFAWKGFVQNEEQKEYFSRIIQRKLVVVPNPVSNAFFDVQHDYSGKTKRIIAVGRLNEQKNFPMLIDAVDLLVKSGICNFEVHIYGEGEEENNLRTLIAQKGVDEECKLKGRSENMPIIYNDYNIFVMTSNYEGMPNTLMEAMASGLACISTDCPTGPSDLITDGQNGFLIDIGNSQQLFKALNTLMDDYELQISIGRNGKSTVQRMFGEKSISMRFVENILEGEE